MVSNPYLGVEEWFEPGKEIQIVHSQEEAVDTYKELLTSSSRRAELGFHARGRLLQEHTYRHRARQLLDFVTAKPSGVTDRQPVGTSGERRWPVATG
jgi:spore maturation protein CgeB